MAKVGLAPRRGRNARRETTEVKAHLQWLAQALLNKRWLFPKDGKPSRSSFSSHSFCEPSNLHFLLAGGTAVEPTMTEQVQAFLPLGVAKLEGSPRG